MAHELVARTGIQNTSNFNYAVGTIPFDCVVATSGGDYTTLSAALTAGKKAIYIKEGAYSEVSDLAVPNANTLIVGASKGVSIDFGVNKFTTAAGTQIFNVEIKSNRDNAVAGIVIIGGDNNCFKGCKFTGTHSGAPANMTYLLTDNSVARTNVVIKGCEFVLGFNSSNCGALALLSNSTTSYISDILISGGASNHNYVIRMASKSSMHGVRAVPALTGAFNSQAFYFAGNADVFAEAIKDFNIEMAISSLVIMSDFNLGSGSVSLQGNGCKVSNGVCDTIYMQNKVNVTNCTITTGLSVDQNADNGVADNCIMGSLTFTSYPDSFSITNSQITGAVALGGIQNRISNCYISGDLTISNAQITVCGSRIGGSLIFSGASATKCAVTGCTIDGTGNTWGSGPDLNTLCGNALNAAMGGTVASNVDSGNVIY